MGLVLPMQYILSNEWLRNLCLLVLAFTAWCLGGSHPLTGKEALAVAVYVTTLYLACWLNNRILHHFLGSKKNIWLYFIPLVPNLAVVVFVENWTHLQVPIAAVDPWTLNNSVVHCLIFLFFGFAINLTYREIMRLQTALETELLAKRNELRFLQNQVNPHFLFNSLNNLYSSSIAEPENVSGHILQMADLLRYQLSSAKQEFVPLAEEVVFLENYMDVEARRLGPQVDLTIETRGDFLKKNIAPLLFLPFLENAFKYAMGGISTAKIDVRINVEAFFVQFFVKNSLPENVGAQPVSIGIGIENAQKRLELLYPRQFLLLIKPAETVFWVDLKIEFPAQA